MYRKQMGIALVLCFATVSQAAVVTTGDAVALQDLIDGTETITSGDKTFVDFAYNATGDNPVASDINVIPVQDGDGNVGIRFQAGFVDLPGGGASDALITYTVVAPAPLIVAVDLYANTTVSGSGVVQIAETFLPDYGDIGLDVFDNGTLKQLIDSVNLSDSADYSGPVMTLPVQKDIFLFASDNGVAGTVSFIDQIYRQVPEPSSFALIVLGLIGMIPRRRE